MSMVDTLSYKHSGLPLKLSPSLGYVTALCVLPRVYRAMHYSAKRGLEISCRLSVCMSVSPSVTLVDHDHTG